MQDLSFGSSCLAPTAVEADVAPTYGNARQFGYLTGQLRQAPSDRFNPYTGQTAPGYEDQISIASATPVSAAPDAHYYAEFDRCLTEQLVEHSFTFAQPDDTWRTIAQRVDPDLSGSDIISFATYIKHINGNRPEPKAGDLVATRSTQEIESIIRVQMAALYKQLKGF